MSQPAKKRSKWKTFKARLLLEPRHQSTVKPNTWDAALWALWTPPNGVRPATTAEIRIGQEQQSVRRSFARLDLEPRCGENDRSHSVSSTIVPLYEEHPVLPPSYLISQRLFTDIRDSMDSRWSLAANASDVGEGFRAALAGHDTVRGSKVPVNLALFELGRQVVNVRERTDRDAKQYRKIKKVRSESAIASHIDEDFSPPRTSPAFESTEDTQPTSTDENIIDLTNALQLTTPTRGQIGPTDNISAAQDHTSPTTAQGTAMNTMPISRDITQPTTAQGSSMDVAARFRELDEQLQSSSWGHGFPTVPTDRPAIGTSSSAAPAQRLVWKDGEDEIWEEFPVSEYEQQPMAEYR